MNRTIYSFSTTILANEKQESIEYGWVHNYADFVQSSFEHIISLPEGERVLDREDEWFFYLANLSIDKRPNDPTFEDCIYGYFEWVRIGLRTDLKKRSTMETRSNPKDPDESETRKAFFYFRLSDGLFLLDTYATSVINYKRIEEYLTKKAPDIFEKYHVRNISFSHLINKKFLEDLEKFSVIRLARIRLQVSDIPGVSEDDFLGQLEDQSRLVKANYFDLILGRKHAKKNGLLPEQLKGFINKFLKHKQNVISGTIEGARADGGPSVIKLNGVEEKFKRDFPADELGEVLPQEMFAYMMDKGNTHDVVSLS